MDRLTGNVFGFVRNQEEDGVGDVHDLSHFSHRRHLDQSVAGLIIQGLGLRGIDETRGHTVHVDPIPRQLQAKRMGLDVDNEAAQRVLAQIKHLEHEGFTFEAAEASVELMFHRLDPDYRPPFELLDYFVITERRHGRGLLAEATVKVRVGDTVKFTAAEGNGPVNALATALQDALVEAYPVLRTVRLTDYKVRILDSKTGTGASTRVLIDFQSGSEGWTTVGASTNIIEASWRALADSMEYALLRLGMEGAGGA